ncbi:hypothetical protein JG688_00003549 [Phytophthora aleatoria]|uniref:RxLR effector protein n=1 Tax=Phytophthora aleatoria TaxID=2496075 RepID=A0A8J5ISZ7_9STRA|nr:hypothetical protein JG688_00003549 [Phytophthora aleatoria]
MKTTQFVIVIAMVISLATSVSFSELTGMALSPAHVSAESSRITDVTSDEEERIYGGSNAKILKYPSTRY